MPVHDNNGWTGGQYSFFRAVFGLYLLGHFAMLLPWGAEIWSDAGVLADAYASPLAYAFPNVLTWFSPPWFVTAWLVAGCVLSGLFIIGWRDRLAAVALWYILTTLLGRNPLILNPALPYLGWLLVAHAFLPSAPFGSFAARGRPDPDGGWRMPGQVFFIAWILMAVGYSYSGLTKLISPSWLDGTAVMHILSNPLARPTLLRDAMLALPESVLKLMTWTGLAFELAFAPLVLFRRARPWMWIGGLLMHVTLMTLLDFANLSLGMVMLHLFTFNPAWLPARVHTYKQDALFYDGYCGLCHRWVRFILAEDREGRCFVLSPLQGDNITHRLTRTQRESLPDSVVVLTGEGRLLTRSAAVLHIMDTLGGAWRIAAWLGSWIPRPVRDAGYDAIAAVRHKLFRKPSAACPMVPPHLRERFVY